MNPNVDAFLLSPEIAVTATFALVLLASLRERGSVDASGLLVGIAGIGLIVAFIATCFVATGDHGEMIENAYVVDDFSLVGKGIVIASTFLVLLLGTAERWKGEYLTLLLSSLLGMMLVVSARDLLLFFVAFELFAIPGYLLTGWNKRSRLGHEGVLKYYLLGVLATAVMLYGMSLLFGIAGGTSFSSIAEALDDSSIARIAILFVLIGLVFKVSAVPFHFWAPDAYESAPLPIAAFLSVVTKAAGMLALLLLVVHSLSDAAETWGPILFGIAILTMTAGNVIALRQRDLVRLLAYSSIAQAGYMLMPLALVDHFGGDVAEAVSATVEYLLIYAVTNLAAFAAVIVVAHRRGSTHMTALNGLFYVTPALAVATTVAFFSLAGMPPFGGWFAKFVVFKNAIEADSTAGVILVVVAAVNTAIGLVYYAGVVRHLWMPLSRERDSQAVPVPLVGALVLTSVAVVLTGVLPGLVTEVGDWTAMLI